ncbi:hypothetical protein OsI_20692 [Oryza sativa Indica Group]|jgi:hypothetical protein|uniref:Uncharacterized protein n=1 Tax=Oryza sativa subsp. indica TaxID=39946 RepID=B8B063_ORYSI|nr:hypothetical protein OsI_20692 [Oryza sativa Indica Group]
MGTGTGTGKEENGSIDTGEEELVGGRRRAATERREGDGRHRRRGDEVLALLALMRSSSLPIRWEEVEKVERRVREGNTAAGAP